MVQEKTGGGNPSAVQGSITVVPTNTRVSCSREPWVKVGGEAGERGRRGGEREKSRSIISFVLWPPLA